LPLTAKEFRMLEYFYFCAHPSQVFSQEQLLAALWGTTNYVDNNTVAVTGGRRRQKQAGGGIYLRIRRLLVLVGTICFGLAVLATFCHAQFRL
jgi:DNA-binding response OmpR family regulator